MLFCKVCGKQAYSIHYEVLTCNACKSFFHRNKINPVKTRCRNNARCYYNHSIHKCAFCRLKRCISVGMYSKHESIEHITILENAVDIDSMKAIEAALSHLHISTYNPVFPPSLDEMLSQPIFLNTYKNYKIVCSWPRPEFELIQEQKLLRTFRSSFNDEPKNKHFPDTIHTKDWLTIDAILGVQYLMTLPFFNNLSHMDRIIFGRNSTVRVMCFTVFYKNYEKGNCFIEQPDGLKLNIPEHNQLFMNTKLDKLYVKKFDTNSNNQSLVPFFENLISEEEYLLMKAIIACDPAATNNLSENGRKLIAAQRNKYINILYTLCLNKEGKINGSLRMGNLIRFSRLMEIQQKQLKEFILLSRMYQDGEISHKGTFFTQHLKS